MYFAIMPSTWQPEISIHLWMKHRPSGIKSDAGGCSSQPAFMLTLVQGTQQELRRHRRREYKVKRGRARPANASWSGPFLSEKGRAY